MAALSVQRCRARAVWRRRREAMAARPARRGSSRIKEWGHLLHWAHLSPDASFELVYTDMGVASELGVSLKSLSVSPGVSLTQCRLPDAPSRGHTDAPLSSQTRPLPRERRQPRSRRGRPSCGPAGGPQSRSAGLARGARPNLQTRRRAQRPAQHSTMVHCEPGNEWGSVDGSLLTV